MPSLITILWIAAVMSAAMSAGLAAASRIARPAAGAPVPAPLALTAPPLPDRYRCRRWRVLVVTPRALVGHQIARMLQGHDVEIATHMDAALAAMSQVPELDVILYTLAMPGLSALELAKQYPQLRSHLVAMIERTTSSNMLRTLAATGIHSISLPPCYAELATAVDFAANAPRETPVGWPQRASA